ncbi:MAG TPA: clostripain-related cysteine peptidase [Candidatus Ozemobacteraceae bacterium]|nr:clostripain-related cysteine peptidase [Candidatus Ozemobacteraceae bacterium]
MKRVLSIIAVALMVAVFVSPVSAAEKEWTWLVFLNADNNLDEFGVTDQNEMAKIGSNDYLNIVSLIDREKGPATLNYIEKDNIVPVADMGEVDMGDYKFLTQWVKDMTVKYPAKHYALIIWNHGSGWKNNQNQIIKGISYDDSTGNHITTEQLGLAMAEIKAHLGRNLDILSNDACLMQMMEVAYAVKDSCDFFVASEETEPGDGYPYDGILATLKPGMTAAEFVKPWVAAYSASYNGGTQGNSASTQSAIDLSKLNEVKDAIDGFAKAVIAGKYGTQFKDALTKVQKFYYRTNIDLMHLVQILKPVIKDEGFQTAATKLETALGNAIAANGTTGATMRNAKGLAIYFPATSYSFDAAYAKLAFAADCQWDEMVADYYKKITPPQIIADLENNDVASLRDYVANSGAQNREVSRDLITKLNFRVFAEGGMPAATQEVVKTLVNELLQK